MLTTRWIGQLANQLVTDKHVCIYELQRKGREFTAEVVCTVCGAYLSSQNVPQVKDKPAPSDHPRAA